MATKRQVCVLWIGQRLYSVFLDEKGLAGRQELEK